MTDYWHKQADQPLFPDLLWSRPETRRSRGKLLIIGGQAQEFSGVASAFMTAEHAGAGTVRVIMPDSTEKVTRMLPNIEYAPSNPSGSFSKSALASFLDASTWADHVLLAGDLGKNSETTTILDGYLLKCPTPVTISQNALDSIRVPYSQLLQRPVTLILDTRGLQKLGIQMELTQAVTSSMNQVALAQVLHELSADKQGAMLCQTDSYAWVSANGQVSSTAHQGDIQNLAATAAVWAMQHPTKLFEALTTSIIA